MPSAAVSILASAACAPSSALRISIRSWLTSLGLTLGIDAGGTKTVCLLADEHGTIVAEARRGGANLQAVGELEVEKVLHDVMEEALDAHDVRPAAICLGIAGVDRPDDAVIARLEPAQKKLAANGKLGPVARLMPTTTATTLRKGREAVIIDGPFAETKEQLLGFYVVERASLEEAIETARELAHASTHGSGAFEIRPIMLFKEGSLAK